MPVAKGSRLGPYEIAAAIGAGGMGEVYRAKDTRLERYVAVKIIHSNLPCTPEFKSRFEREALILSSLSHPHICSLYDVGKEGNLEFLVMELLDGETLSNRLRKGSLPVSAVVRLGIEIAEALAAAQRLGIIHRDLKPANIMLTASGANLMDFGLAKPSIVDKTGAREIAEMATATMQNPSTPLSGANTLIGTIQYMAPEQIEGKGADERSDIFALGTVLYEAVAGRRAFEGKTNISVASAISQQDPPPIPDDPPILAYRHWSIRSEPAWPRSLISDSSWDGYQTVRRVRMHTRSPCAELRRLRRLALTSRRFGNYGAVLRMPAWTGVSGGRILAARSARRC